MRLPFARLATVVVSVALVVSCDAGQGRKLELLVGEARTFTAAVMMKTAGESPPEGGFSWTAKLSTVSIRAEMRSARLSY